MDSTLFFAIVIVGLVVLMFFLPGWIRRSSRSAGDRAGHKVATSQTERLLAELGTPLVIHAPATAAREIVDGVVLQQPRRFTPLDGGAYGIRFVEPDDAVVRLIDDPDGTRMQIEQTREHLGMPQNLEFWRDLRSRVASGAGAQDISVADGIRAEYSRDAGEPAVWRIVREDERS
ncbi:hypothetical protein [Microbacterium sp. OVT16B]|uniref:hypothetical protein n=1 Tax=Microbacterium sp. OVT16B TaxID=2862682 RepID=UPI001CC1AAB1|nr:hypothetical protein [Microbacterium sp. OVT16B]